MRSREHSVLTRSESHSSGGNCPKASPARGRFCFVRRPIRLKSLADVANWRRVEIKQSGWIVNLGHMGKFGL